VSGGVEGKYVNLFSSQDAGKCAICFVESVEAEIKYSEGREWMLWS
jgi:hypothetical protein